MDYIMTVQQALQLLELTPPFTLGDLKKAYREAQMVWHPDRFQTGTELHAKAHGKTCLINDAFKLLSQALSDGYDFNSVCLERGIPKKKSKACKPPQTALEYNIRGLAFYRAGRPNKAVADFSNAILLDPAQAEYHCNRGTIYLHVGENELAIKDLLEAQRLQPSSVVNALLARAYNNRGIALTRKRKYEQSVSDFSEAIRLDPTIAVYYYNRAFAWQEESPSAKRDEQYSDLCKAIQIDPLDARFYYLRSRTQKEDESFLVDCNKAIELAPTNPDYYFRRAGYYYRKGQLDNEIADVSKAIDLDPETVGYYWRRARIYERTAELDKAIEDYGHMIKLDPNEHEIYEKRGKLYNLKRDYEKVIADYDNAIKLLRTKGRISLPYLSVRLRACFLTGDYEGAIRDCSELIELYPKWTLSGGKRFVCAFFSLRAEIYANLGHNVQALEDLNCAIGLDPFSRMSIGLHGSPMPTDRMPFETDELLFRRRHSMSLMAAVHAKMGDYNKAVNSQEQFLTSPILVDAEIAEGRRLLANYEAMRNANNYTVDEIYGVVTGYPVAPDPDTRTGVERMYDMIRCHMGIKNNEYPEAMTLGQDAPDVTLSQLAREVRDMINNFTLPADAEAPRLMNAQKALANRLKYSIEELQKALDTQTPTNEKTPCVVEETPEIKDLRRTLRELREAYEALPAVEEIKAARETERARINANKRYHFWQKRAEDAKEGRYPETFKGTTEAEKDAEVASYLATAEEARREYWRIKKESPQERLAVLTEKLMKAEVRLASLEEALAK
jgi:tetratricopeptide (TPR) repeat protein